MKCLMVALPLIALAACDSADKATADVAASSSARKLAPAETASSTAVDAPANSIRHLSTQAKMHIAFQKVLDLRVVRERDTKPLAFLETSFGPVLMTGTTMLGGGKSGYGEFKLHYFQFDGQDGLNYENTYGDIRNYGDYGDLPQWSLDDQFADAPTLKFVSATAGNGYGNAWVTLVTINPWGPSESYVPTHAEFYGPNQEYICEGKISKVEKNVGFEVVVKGTLEFVDKYVFRDGKFVGPKKSQFEDCGPQ